jgi:quercetin dioxygenase-like cupin family protein
VSHRGAKLERIEFRAGGQLVGVPHDPGTTEYLTCEHGQIRLSILDESWVLSRGDVVVFAADQTHTYRCIGAEAAAAYSLVMLS